MKRFNVDKEAQLAERTMRKRMVRMMGVVEGIRGSF